MITAIALMRLAVIVILIVVVIIILVVIIIVYWNPARASKPGVVCSMLVG